LLERLASGGAVGSYWLELGSIAAAEVIAAARPDAIIFDTQHGLWDKQTLFGGFAAIRGKASRWCASPTTAGQRSARPMIRARPA
jgi:2-keto-3-deoxy-L-rhamnonate aldolase RhmA